MTGRSVVKIASNPGRGNRPAIWRLDSPWPTSPAASRSRRVRGVAGAAGGLVAGGRPRSVGPRVPGHRRWWRSCREPPGSGRYRRCCRARAAVGAPRAGTRPPARGRDLGGQPGLARSTDAGERDQARSRQQPLHLYHRCAPVDEAGQLRGELAFLRSGAASHVPTRFHDKPRIEPPPTSGIQPGPE